MDTLPFADAFRTAAILSAFSHASAQGEPEMAPHETGRVWLLADTRVVLLSIGRRIAAYAQLLAGLVRRRPACEIPNGAVRWTPAFPAVIGPIGTDRTRRLLSHFAFYDVTENQSHHA